jgi:putative membrane protein
MPSDLDDPRTSFAAERTFLAWIRTGLGLMGVGFALARFGLFLREFHGNAGSAPQHTGMTVDAGVALVSLGVAVNIAAIAHHIRTVRKLRTGTWQPGQIATGAVILAAILALIGIASGIYLVFLR